MGWHPVVPKKMVQSLKEIVNCPEREIYAMLKECNMDPNEAVNCLLSQEISMESQSSYFCSWGALPAVFVLTVFLSGFHCRLHFPTNAESSVDKFFLGI
ncbi:hypothetical protein Ancab_025673 [Ancistrocladus abbreviatus]